MTLLSECVDEHTHLIVVFEYVCGGSELQDAVYDEFTVSGQLYPPLQQSSHLHLFILILTCTQPSLHTPLTTLQLMKEFISNAECESTTCV